MEISLFIRSKFTKQIIIIIIIVVLWFFLHLFCFAVCLMKYQDVNYIFMRQPGIMGARW